MKKKTSEHYSVDDLEMSKRIFDQAMELWIQPELERREKMEELPPDFVLEKAQVVMNLNKPIEVRFNNEVTLILEVKLKKGIAPIQKGDSVLYSQIEKVVGSRLTEVDPNAAHLSLVRFGKKWIILFDFRYNGEIVREHINLAGMFLETDRTPIFRSKT